MSMRMSHAKSNEIRGTVGLGWEGRLEDPPGKDVMSS